MGRSLKFAALLGWTCPFVLGAAVFNWPDPLVSGLDDKLYVFDFSTVSSLATGCVPRDNSTVAAQWLRLAYHDMATHDSEYGTGGLDASIVFEFSRAQSLPAADLSFHIAVGEETPQAGPATVPEPQQDLASHIASFKRQGFNETEMISLVACGHSLGGVRQADFSLIVTEEVPSGIQPFASTIGFDNTVVTEYLDSTTENVLVMGSNISTRSDLRIFSSDGNVTMQNMALSTTFNEICADLIERMINTVSSDLKLTDTIEPIDFKVGNTLLFPQGGSLALLATLRIINSALNRTSLSQTDTSIRLYLTPVLTNGLQSHRHHVLEGANWNILHHGGCSVPSFQVTQTGPSLHASLKGVSGFTFHSFNASIDLATSIPYFWFEVDNNDGSAP
ncbi:heme peroxidase [Mycena galopus ATCC 62051]|nr:heme peroxidase [Mycena galopus ATCC 62051]